jgi:hypothetical protein
VTNCCSACSLPSASRSAMGWSTCACRPASAHAARPHPSGADRHAPTAGTRPRQTRPGACAPGPARPGHRVQTSTLPSSTTRRHCQRDPPAADPPTAHLTEHY